jgi:hypothetical protein
LRGTSNLGIISVLNDVMQLIIYGHAWKACPAIAAVKLQINAMCQKRKCIFYADSMIFIKFIVHSIRSHSAIRESRRHVRLRNTWLRQFLYIEWSIYLLSWQIIQFFWWAWPKIHIIISRNNVI